MQSRDIGGPYRLRGAIPIFELLNLLFDELAIISPEVDQGRHLRRKVGSVLFMI